MKTIDLPTYQAVVLQSRAQRAIKTSLTAALRPYGITMMQWSIIGLIADAGDQGMRISDVARLLDTSLAFVTTSVNVLEAKGVVSRSGHAHDNRAKMVRLNPTFAKNVASIEKTLSEEQHKTVYGQLTEAEIATYFAVLGHIAGKA